jgi:tetratricopeptide (TPR) repeat protein
MRDPARLLPTLLAVAAATLARGAVAAAADRFVPADPGFAVARVSQLDEALRGLIAAWRAQPDSERAVMSLGQAFVERARSQREPRYFGRAEALLAPLAARPGATAALRRLYAESLQFRHAFVPAERVLDTLLSQNARDADARLQRASLRLTRGDFSGARADCVQLVTHRALSTAALACMATGLAGSGELARGRLLLEGLAAHARSTGPGTLAYLRATRAELLERAGYPADAIAEYREAVRLAPHDDSIRAALADVLLAQGDDSVSPLLQVENPSLALLVRRVPLARGAERDALVKRACDWLALEAARGDAIHHREAALLALAIGQPAEALSEARRNFESQRELADVRLLARAAISADDGDTRNELGQWLRDTGYQDVVTENILAGRPRS